MVKTSEFVIAMCMVFVSVTFILVTCCSITAFAATPATTAGIQITLTKEDGVTAAAGYTADMITVTDAADQTLSKDTDYKISISGNIYTITDLSIKQTYNVIFTSSNGDSLSVAVPITSFSAANKAVKAKCVDRTSFDIKKVGVLGGLVVGSDGAVKSSVVVRAVLGTTTYTTASKASGAYKLYVPTGKYSLVIVGKDTQTDYKNILTAVNVTAGQMCGPMTDQNAETEWATGEKTLGLTVNDIHGSDLAVTGVANSGSTVSVFAYSSSTSKLTLLASAVAAKAKSPATTGAYKVTLPEYQPGQSIVIRAKDTAGNIYDCTTYKASAIALNSMTLAADSTAATVGKPIDITFADSANSKLNSYLQKNISTVAVVNDGTSTTLTPTTQYTVTSGKITILASVFQAAKTYTIKVTATGYNQASVDQVIGAAAQIKGTGTAATSGTITATSSALTSLTGSVTITLSSAISGLTTNDIVVKKGYNELWYGGGYTITGENTSSISITFQAGAIDWTSQITVTITKANFTINGGNPIAVANNIGRPITASSDGIYRPDGTITLAFLGETFQDFTAENFVVKKNGVPLVLNTDYTMNFANYKITFLAHAALSPTSVITVVVTKNGYSFNNGTPITVANHMYYEVTGVSNGISSPTGTTTITLSMAIPGLSKDNIAVSVFGTGADLWEGTDYTLSDLSGTSFTITFAEQAGIGTNDVLVGITKGGYYVNEGQAILVENNTP